MWNHLLFISLSGVVVPIISSDVSDCKCIIYYLCNAKNRTINTDGTGIIDRRAGFPKCESQDEICCKLEDQITIPTTKSATFSCGVRNTRGIVSKIFNDEEDFNFAEFGEFPWMVAVLNNNGTYRCGGSLIHPSVVLTAAHCVMEKNTYFARAGEWDSAKTEELRPHQDIKVSSVKIHENYRSSSVYNDIALLFLESSFTFDSHINTICLPPANVIVSGRCYTHGWGRERFKNGSYPSILKKIEVPMVSNDQCQKYLRKTRLGPYFELHRSFVCAGGEEGKDACLGDGGGPLVCRITEDEEQYQQIGIVSWGIDCGNKDVPGVYANVPFLRRWIDKQMKENSFDIN